MGPVVPASFGSSVFLCELLFLHMNPKRRQQIIHESVTEKSCSICCKRRCFRSLGVLLLRRRCFILEFVGDAPKASSSLDEDNKTVGRSRDNITVLSTAATESIGIETPVVTLVFPGDIICIRILEAESSFQRVWKPHDLQPIRLTRARPATRNQTAAAKEWYATSAQSDGTSTKTRTVLLRSPPTKASKLESNNAPRRRPLSTSLR